MFANTLFIYLTGAFLKVKCKNILPYENEDIGRFSNQHYCNLQLKKLASIIYQYLK